MLGRGSLDPDDPEKIDIDDLREKLRDQKSQQMTNRKSFGLGGNDEEAKRDPKRPMVVGIGDVRKALKQNIEIKTY